MNKQPQWPCQECGSTSNTDPCASCGANVCPKHRAGLGSISDGYTCKDCLGYGFAAATQFEHTSSRLKRHVEAIPAWFWFLLAVLIGTLVGLLREKLSAGS